MREKFEKFLGLEAGLKDGSIIYQEDKGRYRTSKFDASFINGAWYAFQEQQKKIQAVIDLLNTPMSGTVSDLLRDLEDVLQ